MWEWRYRLTEPLILNLGIRCRCGNIHAPAVLTPGERAPVPVWMFWRRKNLLPLPRIEPRSLGRPARSIKVIIIMNIFRE
jgi:hypothetical protein